MGTTIRSALLLVLAAGVVSVLGGSLHAGAPNDKGKQAGKKAGAKGLKQLLGLRQLAEDYDIWIDPKRKLVVIDGEVSLREGTLEMLACPKNTKEHESVIALNCKAMYVHAALLAVGAEPGRTVRTRPEYVPAAGQKVDVWILWIDKKGKKRMVRGQQWVRHMESKKAMEHPWIFAGSGFWVDETTKERHYHGDAGYLICVSNFGEATLDLPIESSKDNTGLLYEAYTERIPARGTHVRVVLIPQPERIDPARDSAAKPEKEPQGSSPPESEPKP